MNSRSPDLWAAPELPHKGPAPQPMRQVPLALTPAAPRTLDNYVAGANAAALEHLRALPLQRNSGTDPGPPVYLWGTAGSGKTHLLQGLAAQLRATGQPMAWFHASSPTPWELPDACGLVVLDDCQCFDALAQHAAFVLFIQAQSLGLPLAAAGNLPPADLPLRDDLRTRLAWGHVFALQPLGEVESLRVLHQEALRRGLEVPAEVASYLLTRFPRDLGSLMKLLAALDEHGLSTQRRLTIPLVRDLIARNPDGLR